MGVEQRGRRGREEEKEERNGGRVGNDTNKVSAETAVWGGEVIEKNTTIKETSTKKQTNKESHAPGCSAIQSQKTQA